MNDAPKPQPSPERKRYEAPKLIEYGDIATLTQGTGLTKNDSGGKGKVKVG
jgi:hypothetical protein